VAHSLRKLLPFAVLAAGAALAQDGDPAKVLESLKGFDSSGLTATAKKELVAVFKDEFDYCGKPLTLLESLKKGDACKHTRRMAQLAKALAADGNAATDIILTVSRYNQGFLSKRFAFKPDDRMCLGARDARVTVVEFSDFECPFCGAARPVLEDFAKKHGEVRLCSLPFPLSGHPHAMLAGSAALFARDAGKFWPVHDALFENQTALSDGMVAKILTSAGLDAAAFAKAFAAGKYNDELNASKQLGTNAGVGSTPTLYFNGRKHSLGFAEEALTLSMEDELDWLSGKNAWPSN
jgi:protein-disulfide isomerase